MLVITDIQYNTQMPIAQGGRLCDYRHLIFSVKNSDGAIVRFLVDEQGIRILGSPVSKGLLSNKHIEKIAVIRHPNAAFSVIVFFPRSLFKGSLGLLGLVRLPSNGHHEDIGTSFGRFKAEDVEQWLRNLGYTVESIDSSEVATIVTLRFPHNERSECDRDLPLREVELPSLLWLDAGEHIAGIFRRVDHTKIYELVERATRAEAQQRGIVHY